MCSPALNLELQLDWLKQKGAIKRVLFLDTHQHQYRGTLVIDERKRQTCQSFTVYLRVGVLSYF